MKTLFFLGHPGHELLAYKFIKEHKPFIAFLTTGSGNNDQPRIHESIELVESLGLKVLEPFEPYNDRQIYDLIINKKFDPFIEAKESLKQQVNELSIERIIGDALEGYNPSHDLCRYMINAVVKEVNDIRPLANYDFIQDEIHKNAGTNIDEEDILIKLSDEDLRQKLQVSADYSQLKSEVERFISVYGKGFFKTEYFRRISSNDEINTWGKGRPPFYEIHGLKRVEEGIYKQAILFKSHMKPLAELLLKI